ncbi:MAG: carboxypeptidase-like regulatory domain-containing protein, partial [Acidobacteriota bacterium]
MSRIVFSLPAALAVTMLAVPAFSQESRGSITGRIVDTSDSVVVGARIRVTNLQTGMTGSAVANESGSFLVPFLLPGLYRLTAEMSGFKTYSQDQVQLRVNDTLDIRIRLEVGAITETVNVQSSTTQLDTADS